MQQLNVVFLKKVCYDCGMQCGGIIGFAGKAPFRLKLHKHRLSGPPVLLQQLW
jgi:hypothetical protein